MPSPFTDHFLPTPSTCTVTLRFNPSQRGDSWSFIQYCAVQGNRTNGGYAFSNVPWVRYSAHYIQPRFFECKSSRLFHTPFQLFHDTSAKGMARSEIMEGSHLQQRCCRVYRPHTVSIEATSNSGTSSKAGSHLFSLTNIMEHTCPIKLKTRGNFHMNTNTV